MKRPARLLLAAYLVTIIAGGSGSADAADAVALQHDLVNVTTSNQVLSAVWMRQSDSYSLKVVLDRSAAARTARKPWNPRQEAAKVNAAAPVEEYRPQLAPDGPDRGSFFVGNTIANLRGLDPVFDCRTLTLVDGRRTGSPQTTPTQVNPSIARAANIKNPQIDVWLLKADGAQIHPVTSTCELGSKASPPREDVTISYGYSVADIAQAVAVAIRIDGDYYIEKLQPLAAPPTGQ